MLAQNRNETDTHPAAGRSGHSISIFHYHISDRNCTDQSLAETWRFRGLVLQGQVYLLITYNYHQIFHHSCRMFPEYNTEIQKHHGCRSSGCFSIPETSSRPHSGDALHFNGPLFSLTLLQHAPFRAKVAMEMDFNVRRVRTGSVLSPFYIKSGSSRKS